MTLKVSTPPAGKTKQSRQWGFTALLILFTVYAAAFIYRTSFEMNGVRFFCLFDDAMISMRYARNLAHGLGLVWNPGGERVEGFTNPLWVLYMSFFHLFPIPPPKISLCIQLSGAVCMLLVLVYVRKIALFLTTGSRLAAFSAVALTAFYIPLVNWSLQGMEVSLLALIVTGAVWMALRIPGGGQTPLPFYFVLGAGTLVRIDITPLAVVLLATLMITDQENRRKHLLIGGSILLLSLGAQTALRYAYFGELLPNTYYLKMTGVSIFHRVQRGGGAFLDFASGMSWIVFLFPFVLLLLRRDWSVLLIAALFLTQCAYSIYVGGDAWEWWGGSNRYIAIVMPLFFVLFGSALSRLKTAWERMISWRPHAVRAGTRIVVCLCLLLSYFQLNTVVGSVGMSAWVDGGSFLVSRAFGHQPGVDAAEVMNIVSWLVVPDPLELFENVTMVQASTLLDTITTPDARVLVAFAGALPYFSDRCFIDLLGKNDKTVARMEARATVDPNGKTTYTPGHSKWNYSYSIGELQPDVIFQLWIASDEARPFLDARYCAVELQHRTVYLRRGSRAIRWETVERMAGTEKAVPN